MFNLSKKNMYHMPHNTAKSREVLLLIRSLDSNKKTYQLKELMKVLLIAEVKKDLFKKYHSTIHEHFTVPEAPSDYEKIKLQLQEIHEEGKRKNGMHVVLYAELVKNGPEKTLKNFIHKRHLIFSKFISNPEEFYEELLETPYSITKTWKQIWIEYIRDIVDFCAYTGILPAFYKVALSSSSDDLDGYYVSPIVERIKKKEEIFYEKILDFKYSNSSINIQRFSQFNIKVRPFFIGLRILSKLTIEKINKIERRLFFATIANIQEEEEIDDAVDYIKKFIENKEDISLMGSISKEGGRVATGMQDFYLESKFLNVSREGRCLYFSITEKGENVLKKIEPNALFFGQHDKKTGLIYTPLVASMLKNFSEHVKNDRNVITIKSIYDYYPKIDSSIIDETIKLLSTLSPSPIKIIAKSKIELSNLSNQYSVSPYIDFLGLDEIDFIFKRKKDIPIRKIKEVKINLPPEKLMEELRIAALTKNTSGIEYERKIADVMRLLPGELIPLGGTTTIAERYSDCIWIVEMAFNNEIQKIAIVIEAKSGNAIKSFDERKEIDNIKETLTFQKHKLKDLKGIWYLVLDSDAIPSEKGHGGLRVTSSQKSFKEKLLFIQITLMQEFAVPTLVTAFGVDAFIEYYKYLYIITKEYNLNKMTSYVQQFFMNGDLFFNDYRYINVLREGKDVKSKLFV